MPYYSMPMRPGLPTVVTIHDVTFFTDPEQYTAVTRHVAQVGHPDGGQAGDAADRAVQRDPRRAGPGARHGPRQDRRRLSRGGPRAVPPAHSASRSATSPRGWGCTASRTSRSSARWTPRKNAPRGGPGLGRGGGRSGEPARARARRAAGAGATTWTTAVAAVPPTCGWCRPGYLPFADLPGFLGGALRGGVPVQRRGVRAAGARGDGVRRAGADHQPDVAAGGGRGRGGVHRAGRRSRSRSRCARCSTIRSGGPRSARPGTPGPRSSPGPRRRPRTWRATSGRRSPGAPRRMASAVTLGHNAIGRISRVSGRCSGAI